MRELLTSRELAAYLKCHPGTIRTAVSNRKLPFIKIGGMVRFDKEAIDEFIKKNSFTPKK